jgi:acyl carrier protein
MLSRFTKARALCRFYGFEDKSERWTVNWWHYADSNVFGDETPEERGYQQSAHDIENSKNWEKSPRIMWQRDIDSEGKNITKILDAETRNNHLGDYDPNNQTVPVSEIKTRIFHILRHFQQVDLRKLDWKATLLQGLKFDDYERIAFLTSVEQEFGTVFEDNVFDNLKTLEDVVGYLTMDRYVV